MTVATMVKARPLQMMIAKAIESSMSVSCLPFVAVDKDVVTYVVSKVKHYLCDKENNLWLRCHGGRAYWRVQRHGLGLGDSHRAALPVRLAPSFPLARLRPGQRSAASASALMRPSCSRADTATALQLCPCRYSLPAPCLPRRLGPCPPYPGGAGGGVAPVRGSADSPLQITTPFFLELRQSLLGLGCA